MRKKLLKWLSLPVASIYLIAVLANFWEGDYEGKSLSYILKDALPVVCIIGIALILIFYEFKAGCLILNLLMVVPIPISFFKPNLGEGTIRFLNILFHFVGWFILLVPLIATLIYKP